MRLTSAITDFSTYLSALSPGQLARHVACHARSRLGQLQLKRIFISPSHACNVNCPHCYEKFAHERFGEELSEPQIRRVLDEFVALGGCFVFFCSGEFLLREDAFRLIRYAREHELVVSITTNGLLLDEATILRLKEAGLTMLFVSLDSADAATHDALRGCPGLFARATEGIRLAARHKLIPWIWTYATRSHADTLEGLDRLAAELDAEGVFVFFTLLSGHLFERWEENLTTPERDEIRRRLNPSRKVLLEFPSERDTCRGGGRDHICVMPSGDVTFCPPVPYSYGHIDQRSLRDCLLDIKRDYERFGHCRGQCIVNFPEYRAGAAARFMYDPLAR